jgi:hypothetical protein
MEKADAPVHLCLHEEPSKTLPERFTVKGNANMLTTIAILLILLYVLGLATSYTMGGLIHLLLVVAVVVVLVRVIQGRRVL